jgi:hypothetical protein
VNLGASGVLAFVSAAAVANIAAVAIFGPRTLGVSADTIE